MKRIDLPPVDQFGPWPPLKRGLVEQEHYFAASAVKGWAAAEEERRRRLDVEEELAAAEELFREREPEIRYIERKVYTPMPPREVRGRTLVIDRATSNRLESVVLPKELQDDGWCAPTPPSFETSHPPSFEAGPASSFRSLAPTTPPAKTGLWSRIFKRRNVHVGMR